MQGLGFRRGRVWGTKRGPPGGSGREGGGGGLVVAGCRVSGSLRPFKDPFLGPFLRGGGGGGTYFIMYLC